MFSVNTTHTSSTLQNNRIGINFSLRIILLCVMSFSAVASPDSNESKRNNWEQRFQPKPINDPDRLTLKQTPAKFQVFIKKLRLAVNKRDAATVNTLISQDFYIDRDFGGIFNPEASPKENFAFCYPLDNSLLLPEYKDSGWHALEKVVSSDLFERVGQAEICSPYCAMSKKPFPHEQLCFDAAKEGNWMISGYIGGGD